MLNLIRNEWMKLWAKKGTWIMTVLLIACVIGLMALTKWINNQNTTEHTDWKANTQEQLQYTKEAIELDLPEMEREQNEETVKILEYRLANDIPPLAEDGRESLIINPVGIGSLVVLLTVIVAAGIVASEFSQGTIKMLLTRPVKRWKIMTSKYVTVLLFGVLLMFIGFAVTVICAYILFPAGAGQELKLDGNAVVPVSVWGHGLYMLVLAFVNVIITATFAFMIGSVFRSNGMAIGLSLFIFFTGNMVVLLLSQYEIVKYLLFTHMDLTMYESGSVFVDGITMPFSLAVLTVYLVIFLLISYTVFTKRDITA
ncbi:ABC transporter permease [Sporosarcina cascadiensis]|uniref:ABC transporter permease n=1 Tax=Sporosarcina cascadiensis TaxID=2660747 RepID=UPI00129B5DF7|nr:ABC transporter permease [Sporosarcina cascadiensis]